MSQPRPAPAPPRGAGSGRAEAAAGRGKRGGQAESQTACSGQYGATIPRADSSANHCFRALSLLQHKTTLGVPKPLRIYLQLAIRMSYHYLEVNSKRLGGRCRMGLGAVNAAPCVHGRRSARGAVKKRPQAAARANHRRHSAPLRAPHRVGAIHYATRSALEPPAAHAGRCGARAVAKWAGIPGI